MPKRYALAFTALVLLLVSAWVKMGSVSFQTLLGCGQPAFSAPFPPRGLSDEGSGSSGLSLTLNGPTNLIQLEVELKESRLELFPGTVDSNSPAYWHGDSIRVFNSTCGNSYMASGSSIENLSDPVQVQLPQPERPGLVWLEAVWKDPSSNVLYGWYHFEPGDLACHPLTAPVIGAAISHDGGLTWEDQGMIIENGYAIDCDASNGFFVGGNGDFSVILDPDGEFFYFTFSNYAGPQEEQGIAVARSAVDDKGQPGTVAKFYNGGWGEPGLGGKVTALLPSSTGWGGPRIESYWGPSVHWNEYLGSYVALLNHTDGEGWVQEGIYISLSNNLLAWTSPQKILESSEWYPQVIGLGPSGTDTFAGRAVRIYIGGASAFILEFSR